MPWKTAPTQPPLTPEHPFCPGRGMVTPLVVPDGLRFNQGPSASHSSPFGAFQGPRSCFSQVRAPTCGLPPLVVDVQRSSLVHPRHHLVLGAVEAVDPDDAGFLLGVGVV